MYLRETPSAQPHLDMGTGGSQIGQKAGESSRERSKQACALPIISVALAWVCAPLDAVALGAAGGGKVKTGA